ncbi:MAG TPA: Sec-independent protein translocase protein TatB [Steroidobacteraceae bacterium]|nr:Sec-independent protein translocase protein TatB [Steroidobacteraceae bacterium]
MRTRNSRKPPRRPTPRRNGARDLFEGRFLEVLIIFVLALIVLGPEKLPRVVSEVGRWVGRARVMARQFREQLEEEVQLEEARKSERTAATPAPAATPVPAAAPAPPPPSPEPAQSPEAPESAAPSRSDEATVSASPPPSAESPAAVPGASADERTA